MNTPKCPNNANISVYEYDAFIFLSQWLWSDI